MESVRRLSAGMMNWLRRSGVLDESYVKKAKKQPIVLPPRIDQLVEAMEAVNRNGSSRSSDEAAVLATTAAGPPTPRSATPPPPLPLTAPVVGVTLRLSDTAAAGKRLRREQRQWYLQQMRMASPPAQVYLSEADEAVEGIRGSPRLSESDSVSSNDSQTLRTRSQHQQPQSAFTACQVQSSHAMKPLPPALKRSAIVSLLSSDPFHPYHLHPSATLPLQPPAAAERVATVGVPLLDYVESVVELRVFTYRRQMSGPPVGAVVAVDTPDSEPDAETVYGKPSHYLPNTAGDDEEARPAAKNEDALLGSTHPLLTPP